MSVVVSLCVSWFLLGVIVSSASNSPGAGNLEEGFEFGGIAGNHFKH